MSALPSKADVCGAQAHVCFGPKADIKALDGLFTAAGYASSWLYRATAQGGSKLGWTKGQ